MLRISSETLRFYKENKDVCIELYNQLVTSAKPRGLDKSKIEGYFEVHHIVPKCHNGGDEKENLVLLTYTEHIQAHLLLCYIFPGDSDLFLSFSLLIELKEKHFSELQDLEIDIETMEKIKIRRSEIMKGENNPMKNPEIARKVSETKKGQPGFFKGKHHTDETKAILRQKTLDLNFKGSNHPMYGKKHSEESLKKMSLAHSGSNNPLFGKHLSDEIKKKISEGHKMPVISPDGIEYPSVEDAAKAVGLHRSTLSKYINKRPEKGWKYKN